MAKSPFSKRDAHHELSRRALIKWSLAAGAAVGITKSDVFGILERTAGKGTAFAAAESQTTLSMHLVGGTGGFAWFQLLWPHHDVAMSGNASQAWHKPGQARLVPGTRKPLAIGPDTPGANVAAARQMTAFLAGNNETHTDDPTSTATLGGNKIFAIASALQSTSSSVVPVVTIGGLGLGTAPGAPQATGVNDAGGIVNLFNSAASRAGAILSDPRNANVYKATYDAFIQFSPAAARPTTREAYKTTSNAAGFLGTNLATRLAITPADLARYGIDGNMRGNVAAIGRAMIVAVKAFKMGLTRSIVLPAMNDDPHGAWNGGVGNRDADRVPPQLKLVFDAFFADLANNVDDNTQQTLADNFVMTINGDTGKSPNEQSGWPDGTPGGCNWIYCWGAGHLFSGWFGGVDRNGAIRGFDGNGNDAAYNAGQTARFALASVAYAIAKRDERLISQFANGITIADRFGPPKVL
jgi:hypothetical protein